MAHDLGGGAVTQVRSRLGTALFTKAAGPDGPKHRARIHGKPGPRWFPEGSPIQQVNGDASMFIGGLRALMLQALHPTAMTAVAEHSGFKADMWGRLARTSRFLAVTTFGTAADAEAAVKAVRAIHERINGMTADGTPYRACDPHLLKWVHIAELDSFLVAHQSYGHRPLDPAQRDKYVAQTAFVAEKLGVVDPPGTEAELRAALAALPPGADRHGPSPGRQLSDPAPRPAGSGTPRVPGARRPMGAAARTECRPLTASPAAGIRFGPRQGSEERPDPRM